MSEAYLEAYFAYYLKGSFKVFCWHVCWSCSFSYYGKAYLKAGVKFRLLAAFEDWLDVSFNTYFNRLLQRFL